MSAYCRLRRAALRPVVAAVASIVASVTLAAPILDPAHITDKTLANGLHAIVKQETGWDLVAVSAFVRSGTLYEPPDASGVAHLMEHLLFRKSNDEDHSVAEIIEGMGGYFNAETNLDFTSVDVVVGSDAFPSIVPLLAKTVLEAEFTAADLEREKRVVSNELTERSGQVEQRLRDLVWSTAFMAHPYGRAVAGTAASVEALSIEAVRDYYRRTFVPENIAIIAVGDLDPDEALAQIEAAFGSYPPGDHSPPAIAAEPPQTEQRTQIVDDAQTELTLFAYAFHAPGISRKRDVCAMDIIWTMLGEGPTSVFDTVLVAEKQLLHGYVLDFVTRRDDGLFVVICFAEPQKEETARTEVLQELRRLAAAPPTDEQLARAKKLLRNSYAFQNETYSGQVNSIGFYEMTDTYAFAIEYMDHVNAITPTDIQEVAERYLAGDNYSLVVMRPAEGEQR